MARFDEVITSAGIGLRIVTTALLQAKRKQPRSLA
jgi:hypothetical protein